MTDIERHIVRLLLDNDCVIVPGFGGFMAHNIAASYDEKNNIFFPPSRTIGFNPHLTMNDSLLAQSYANCYDISYPEALRRIEHDVDVLKQMIETGDGHAICGVGKIYKTKDGGYDFAPEISGIMTPWLYGFEPYEIKMLELDKDEATCPKSMDDSLDSISGDSRVLSSRIFSANGPLVTPVQAANPSHEESPRKEIAVHIPINIVKHIAAACIIMFILLSFPSKLGDSSTSALRQSSIDTSWLYEIMPKEVTSGKPESLNDISHSPKASETANDFASKDNSLSKEQAPCFCIVLSSGIPQSNALAYAERLRERGFDDISVRTKSGMTMVTYNQFASRAEANAAIKKLSLRREFADCWITEIK